ncbi:MAG: c-type cytochrome [Candidatus Acidiferrales bacterium]
MREERLTFRQIALWTLLLFSFGCGVSGCSLGAASPAMRGQELFQNCLPCHQPDGSGNAAIGAPNISGMPVWYVQEELDKFREGARGMEFNDIEGMRMRPVAASLLSEEDVKLVAAYVGSMPQVRHEPTLPGDPKAGAALYATCAACHGNKGEGNVTLKAPQLAGVADWYLATELRKYRSGERGTSPLDREGHMMRPMALTLPNEDAIRNVVAYIGILKP